jgi:hypothetical protein
MMMHVMIMRRSAEVEHIYIRNTVHAKKHVFFPDDDRLVGITLYSKNDFIVFSTETREKCVASLRRTSLDLEFFGPEWHGCVALVAC